MNNIILILLLSLTIFSADCYAQTNKTAKRNIYGKPLTPQNSVAATNLPQILATKDSVAIKVAGEVLDVCQAKGCWMDVKLDDNSVMKVRFKDYGFFVPKDLKGKTVIMNGMAYNKTISVADQRHYAQDAGKSKAEIKKITKPQKSISFLADGVLVK